MMDRGSLVCWQIGEPLWLVMSEYKLVFSVLRLGESKLEVVSQERAGRRRKVEIAWSKKVPDDVPPEDWAEQVNTELAFQDSVAHLPPVFR